MSYALGVDIGTSSVTTAIARLGRGDADPPAVHEAARFSSALFQDAAGVFHHAEAAERLGRSDPGRLVRAVADRIGDGVPIVIGDHGHAAERLYARTARHAVDRVTAGEGSAPAAVQFVLPVRWGTHRTRLVREAILEAGIEEATFVAGPDAAVAASDELDDADAVVAVYDLSASRFVITVRSGGAAAGSTLAVDGIENVGGGDVDDAIVRHVVSSAHELFVDFDSAGPDAIDALSLLRAESVRAKELLATVTEVPIPVRLPAGSIDAVLDRATLGRIAAPTVLATIPVFRRAMRSAALDAGELAAIVLVGGSAGLPVVSRILSDEFGLPIVTREKPDATAACGAALRAVATIDQEVSTQGIPATGVSPHPIRPAGFRRGAAVGSAVVRRGSAAVAAAVAAVVGVQTTTDGGQSFGTDSAGAGG